MGTPPPLEDDYEAEHETTPRASPISAQTELDRLQHVHEENLTSGNVHASLEADERDPPEGEGVVRPEAW